MELESTRIFVKVVQQGSFSRAAEILKLPTSTVSRTVTRLEKEVGTKLLLRTTRSLTLTLAGKSLFDRAVGPVLELEEARKTIQGNDETLIGNVKITATEDHGALVVTPVVGRLMSLYPGLTFELLYSNEVVDLVKGGFDLALRVGKLNPSRFKSIRLGEVSLIAVANPNYLANKDKIKAPKDLGDHAVLVFGPESETAKWDFKSHGDTVRLTLKPHSTANQMQSLVTLASSGGGIAFVPYFTCRKQLASGELIRVLPDWSIASYALNLVSPSISKMPARVKLVADEIAIAAKRVLSKTG